MHFRNCYFRLMPGVLLLCLFLTGCGSGNVSVTGTVTYSDTGEPVMSGMIVFSSDDVIGRAAINNGRYSIGVLRDGDGVPPGTYIVSAEQASAPTSMGMGVDLFGNPLAPAGVVEDVERFFTIDPPTIEVSGRSMTFNHVVERGFRPL